VLTAAAALEKQRVQSKNVIVRLFNNQVGDGNFNMKHFQAGYGTVFDPDMVLSRGRNGSAMEEPSYLFIKGLIAF
jgi:hypothetical protein